MGRRYGVYVIELRNSFGLRGHGRLPALYVGSTHLSALDRFRQHRDGYWTSSPVAGSHVQRLRPELYEDLERVSTREAAERMETERAMRLAEAGFAVHCDGVTRKVTPGRIRPSDERELAAVEDLLDRAVFAAVARRKRPQTSQEIVGVLRWEEDHDLQDLVRTPWDQVGCFAHVDPSALFTRIEHARSRLDGEMP